MKNRKLLLIVSIVLAMTMSLGGTLAYLQDTDADINVMTVGRVSITQNEQERNAAGELVAFTPNKPALPAVGPIEWADEGVVFNGTEYKVFTDKLKNVIDKMVTVTNTGNSDAYVRTIVAIEAPGFDSKNLIHLNYNGTDCTQSGPVTVTIDNVDYVVFAYTYNEKLAANATSAPSLMQLFLDKNTTNEDVAAYGNTWEVLVLSQAIQADGFADAATALNEGFGAVDEDNVKTWFGDWEQWEENGEIGTPGEKNDTNNPPAIPVADAAELAALLEEGIPQGATVALAAANYGTVELKGELKDVTIQGAEGMNVKFVAKEGSKLENVTLSGMEMNYNDQTGLFVKNGAVVIEKGATVKQLVIEDAKMTGSMSCAIGVSEPTAEITLKNSTVEGPKYVVYSSSAPIAQLTIEGCDISVTGWAIMLNGADTVGAKLTINNNNFVNCTQGIAKYLGSSQPEGAATVFTNNTLTNCRAHDGVESKWFTIPGATSTITVSGNTLDGTEWTPGTAQGLGK